MPEPLTDAERQALRWHREGDPRAADTDAELRASLERRYLLIRITLKGGGVLHAISRRGRRALAAP
jgi:hypothetical protein